MKDKIIVIVGPTAVGKTQLGIDLAKAFDGEVINGDSMQVYKGLDIGTAKVTEEEKDGIPHHLIDIKSPEDSYAVSDFKLDAGEKIHEITKRGKLPIVVGGTGLYIESLLYNVSHGGKAEPNPDFREEMDRFVRENGREALHQKLQDKDLKAAEAIHQNNVRRVIRALEVIHETGKKFSDYQDEKKKEPVYDAYVIGLNTDRDVLYDRINMRVDLMLENGLLQEVTWLYKNYPGNIQSKKGIGYKEFRPFLEGRQPLVEAVEQVKQHSRNYAKRQLTWFRNRFEVNQWADLVKEPESLQEVKANIQKFTEGD
ncbi:tRNA dimethylallyltransferase [Alkalibacterium putridalgicola]|uniref:tRNA dimethylallyltransferase n=1 Tax=Alkalibacterium putridalgicola TaxID=426703 RepID=A0A1H7REF9_9LACT|nr:tRNA (adenosine(37)-N6)-dimethylallyltransferase MiaA [Alkalibacterium putridalgicola]GEK88818.1 tRNA dimethylallyltransferase [Alkalibacterium putridalgicola]SEL57787.1 tRNA dimethylallyltransferase [Alkalibacterium putridalgicola]